MAAAIAILDASYRSLISRTYKSTILEVDEIFKDFASLVGIHKNIPVFQSDEFNYVYIKNNEITICIVSISDQVNVMMLLSFLYRFNDVLMDYFKVKDLNKDLIVDNFNLIYELFDEMMDFGMPQLTESSILKDVIKLEANLAKKEEEGEDGKNGGHVDYSNSINEIKDELSEEINSSILRSTTQAVSWRTRGIFYKKNEFFLTVVEKIELIFDFKRNKLIKFKINGKFNVKCYLSGMPNLKIGLNKLIGSSKDESFIKTLKFHQCVDLIKFNDEKVIEFIPPDGTFELLKYSIDYTKRKVSPLVQLKESEYKVIPKSETKPDRTLRVKVSIRTNFPKSASMSKLSVKIPINSTYLSQIDFEKNPKFKTNIGKVYYKFNEDCIVWSILTGTGGDREYSMQSQFVLFDDDEEKNLNKEKEVNLSMDPPPKVTKPNFQSIKEFANDDDHDDNEGLNGENSNENNGNGNSGKNDNIKVEFELPDCIISGLKVDYLKIMENGLNYTSFPWIKYISYNDDDYVYRV